jgi:peptidoglycan/xylan/chitin deacetylase (PgdA/CDA1 family)
MTAMDAMKRLAYASGAFAAHHRWAHRDTLSVPMFHRVLAREDRRWSDADPGYAMRADVFEACLRFFKRHYNVVDVAQVRAAESGEAALPPRALLITFDDGWADNLHVAAPLLRRHGLPSVLFVAAEAVMSEEAEWWQDKVFGAEREGALGSALTPAFRAAMPASDAPEALRAVSALAELDEIRRGDLVASLRPRETGQRMMLTPGELAQVVASGMALGGHGYSHAPLTLLRDSAADLRRSRETLMRIGDGLGDWSTMSFPHGRYDSRIVAQARSIGYRTVFTSDPVLN